MASNAQGRHAKNHEPNSCDGPVETCRPLSAALAVTGHTGTHAAPPHTRDDDVFQAGHLYRLMKAEEKSRLVADIAGGLAQVSRDDVIEKNLAQLPRRRPRVRAARGGGGPRPARGLNSLTASDGPGDPMRGGRSGTDAGRARTAAVVSQCGGEGARTGFPT